MAITDFSAPTPTPATAPAPVAAPTASTGGISDFPSSTNVSKFPAVSPVQAAVASVPAPTTGSTSNTDGFIAGLSDNAKAAVQDPSLLSEGSTLNNSTLPRTIGNSLLLFGNSVGKSFYDVADTIANLSGKLLPGKFAPAPLTNPFGGNKFDLDQSPAAQPAKVAGSIVGGTIPYLLGGEIASPISKAIEGSKNPLVKYGAKALVNAAIPAVISQLSPAAPGQSKTGQFLQQLPANLLFGLTSLIPHQTVQALVTGLSQFGLGAAQGKSLSDNITGSAILTLFGFAHGASDVAEVKKNIQDSAANAPKGEADPNAPNGDPLPGNQDEFSSYVAKQVLDHGTPEEQDALAKQALAVSKAAELKSAMYSDVQAESAKGTSDTDISNELQSKYGLSKEDANKIVIEAGQAKLTSVPKVPTPDDVNAIADQLKPATSPVAKEPSAPTDENGDIVAIARHGTTGRNGADPSFRGWDEQPANQLAPEGKADAKKLGGSIKDLVGKDDPKDYVIVSSDLNRAKDSAKIASDESGVPVGKSYSSLRSQDTGDFTGRKQSEVKDQVQDINDNHPDQPLPGASESHDQFVQRIKDALKPGGEIEKDNPGKKIIVLTHHQVEVLQANDFAKATDAMFEKGIKPGGLRPIEEDKGEPKDEKPLESKASSESPLPSSEPKVTTSESGTKSIVENEGKSEVVSHEKGENPVEKLTPEQKESLGLGNKVAKTAAEINDRLVKKGFDAIPEDEQAKFASHEGARVQDVANVDKYIANTDIETVKDAALGNAPLPKDVLPQILLNRMIDWANKQDDPSFLKQLANSKIATERSETASALESAKYGREEGSSAKEVTKVIKDVTDAKKAEADAKAKKENTTVEKKLAKLKEKSDNAKDEARKEKAATRRPRLRAFIDALPDC